MTRLARASRIVGWFAFLALALCSCSSDDSGPPPTSAPSTTFYRGVLAGSNNDAGALTFRRTHYPTTSAYAARGARALDPKALAVADSVWAVVAIPGAASDTILGTYAAGVLSIIGKGYTFTGSLRDNQFGGVYTRPGHAGGFISLVPTTVTPQAFCGSLSGSGSGGADHASLALLVDGVTIVGICRNDDGTIDQVDGAVNAVNGFVVCNFTGYVLEGTLLGTTMNGTYNSTLGGGRVGTWTTTLCPF